MTPRQAKLLEFIGGYMRANGGVCPTFDEMTVALGIKSRSGVFRFLNALEREGRIERTYCGTRAIKIIEGPPTVDALREMVGRLIVEEGPTRAVAALIDIAREIAPQIGEGA